MAHTRSRLARLIFDNSLLLLAGTIAAVAWANLDLVSYDRVTHSLRFWVNDIDMAFSAMIARVIFPGGHPAIPFLLLLAIADDALGLIMLAVFYPSGPLSL